MMKYNSAIAQHNTTSSFS